MCADIADKFGKKDEFTEGRTHDDWVKYLYEQGREAHPEMPTWDEIREQGVYKVKLDPVIGLKDFRDDPEGHPLATPSGKIEIYSEALASLNDTLELAEDEHINPIPVFTPGFQGYGSTTDEYPLYCTGFHHKSRVHSSYGFIPELEQVARQQLWIILPTPRLAVSLTATCSLLRALRARFVSKPKSRRVLSLVRSAFRRAHGTRLTCRAIGSTRAVA